MQSYKILFLIKNLSRKVQIKWFIFIFPYLILYSPFGRIQGMPYKPIADFIPNHIKSDLVGDNIEDLTNLNDFELWNKQKQLINSKDVVKAYFNQREICVFLPEEGLKGYL
jgi:hypothetical protein